MALSMSNDTESPIPWRAVQLALLTFDAWQRCRNQVAFVKRLLVKDPTQRPSAKETLRDGWFAEAAKQKKLQGRQARKACKIDAATLLEHV
eukprot:symbB.v1.2.022309.t1/scaffold1973.1/size94122/13